MSKFFMSKSSKVVLLAGIVSIVSLTGCTPTFTSPIEGNHDPYAPVYAPIRQPIPRDHPSWKQDSGKPGPYVMSPSKVSRTGNRPVEAQKRDPRKGQKKKDQKNRR